MTTRKRKPLTLVKIPKELRRSDLERRLPANLGKFIDLRGKSFERCQVLGFAGFLGPFSAWLCRCRCGNLFIVRSNGLLYRNQACGCGYGGVERHGGTKTPEYQAWQNIFAYYPEEICERWQSYANFRADMGSRPSRKHFLHRRDLSKPYSKANAAWKTRKEAPQRRPILYKYAGKSLSLIDWAKRMGMTRQALDRRLNICQKLGAPISQVFSTPWGKLMPCTQQRRQKPGPKGKRSQRSVRMEKSQAG